MSPPTRPLDRLFAQEHATLQRIARAGLNGESRDTLTPDDLVGEVYARLSRLRVEPADGRALPVAFAGEMRRALIDRGRRRGAAKRGGGWNRLGFTAHLGAITSHRTGPVDLAARTDVLEAVHAGLEELARRGRSGGRQARLVDLMVFGGLGRREAAETLGVDAERVQADLQVVRAYFRSVLAGLLDGER